MPKNGVISWGQLDNQPALKMEKIPTRPGNHWETTTGNHNGELSVPFRIHLEPLAPRRPMSRKPRRHLVIPTFHSKRGTKRWWENPHGIFFSTICRLGNHSRHSTCYVLPWGDAYESSGFFRFHIPIGYVKAWGDGSSSA